MPVYRLTSNSTGCHPQGSDSPARPGGGDAAGPRVFATAPGDETSGPCVRCGRAGAPWRLAAYVCQVCWAEAFAEQTTTDHAAQRERDRAVQAEQAAAARQALISCGVRRQVTAQMPDWAVLGLLERVESTPVAEVAAWTRVAVEPVGWLIAVREHAERLRALRQPGKTGRFRPGWDWSDSTLAAAQAVMHHAGRVGAADGRVLAWPGMTTLVTWTGLSRRAVHYALTALCRGGFLRRVLVGTRVAGALPGQPLSLATVFELRIPLSPAELAEQADLQRALRPANDTVTTGCPQPTRHVGCTPPSSAGDSYGSTDLEYTGAARETPALDEKTPPRARQDWSRHAALRRGRLANAARELRARVPALAELEASRIEGCLRSWWERHHPAPVPPEGWGQDLAMLLGPWLPPWLVHNPIGLLFSKLAKLDPAATPPPRPAKTSSSSVARARARARREHRRLQAEQRAFAAELRQRQQAAARVDRRGHYQRIAQAAGWARTRPAADPGPGGSLIAGNPPGGTDDSVTVDTTNTVTGQERQ